MEQQEVPLSARFESQGVRPAIDSLSIIFGRSQILPSRPLFTVAYVINRFTPRVLQVATINNVAPDTFDPGHKMLHPSDMSGHKVLYT